MKKTAMILMFVFIALMFVISGCQKNDFITTANTEWRCIQTQCNQTISGQAWAQKNCAQNGDKVECPIVSNGQKVLVPLEKLNITNTQICAQYVCIAEVPVRKVAQPYTVNATTP